MNKKIMKILIATIIVILLLIFVEQIILIKINASDKLILANSKKVDSSEYCLNDLCFVAGTKVITPSGFANIEDLKIGDSVFSRNQETGEIEVKEIVQVYKSNYENDVIKIYTNYANVEATLNHKFYEKNRGWIEAKDLRVDDILINSSNEETRVVKVEREESKGIQEVYNLQIDGNHNYFVGLDCILVHNCCCVREDTVVLTSLFGDTKQIRDIKEGEKVLTFNEKTGEKELKTVTKTTIKNQVTEIVTITFEDGTIITQNLYHEMYTKEGWKSPVNLKEEMTLTEGDGVITKDGLKVVKKIEIELTHEPLDLYVFDTEENHNFYANGILMKAY